MNAIRIERLALAGMSPIGRRDPFALSLSKGCPGFDRLSPNGI